jgi:sulfatase maturation enzyme AslB (radical SAM superfamily)
MGGQANHRGGERVHAEGSAPVRPPTAERTDVSGAQAHPPAGYFRTREKLLTRRGVLWLGQTCNIRCHFCYFLDRIEQKDHPEHPFMDLEKAKAICHDLRYKYGNTSIDIQGGEPTIWRHIEELVAYCHEIGLFPTLITNAIALAKREKCVQLKQAGIRDLLISVQGLGAVYDDIVAVPGGSAKQAQALRNCIEVGIPFRFNTVLSLKAIPQYVDIARLAVSTGALAVNFLAFNPFEDQATGHRSTFNVPRYSDVAVELNKALDVLAAAGVEANVRYFPICMVEERHRKSIYDFTQLPYDPHEWDYDSWSWTGLQPQRMKWGAPSAHHSSLAAITYDSWVFANRVVGAPGSLRQNVRATLSERLRPYPAARERLQKAYRLVAYASGYTRTLLEGRRRKQRNGGAGYLVADELGRDPQVYVDNGFARAQDHCHYQYSPRCDECDVKAICDGFHGDYVSLFGSDEARPIHLGGKVADPLHFIKDQVKIYEPEEAGRPFRAGAPLSGTGHG